MAYVRPTSDPHSVAEGGEPLATLMPAVHFEFYGCSVEVSSPDAGLVEEVRRDFLYFEVPAPNRSGRAQLRMELRLEAPVYTGLPSVPATVVTPRNVCFRDGDTVYVDYFGRGLATHERKTGAWAMRSEDADLVHEAAYLFILSAVGQHLDRIGLHRVHALGVRYRGRAILLLLPSGGGKSTMALSLLSEPGFELIGEDTPLIDRRGRVHPFPLRLGVRPDSPPDIPDRYLRTMRRMEFDPKMLIDIEYFRDRLCPPGEVIDPDVVLIGQRSLGPTSAIEPLPRRKALNALVKYAVVGLGVYQGLEFLLERGAWELVGKGGIASSRLLASVRLLARAPAYRFQLGRDMPGNTRRLLEFIHARHG